MSSAREFAEKLISLPSLEQIALIEQRDADMVKAQNTCELCHCPIVPADFGAVDKCCLRATQQALLDSQIREKELKAPMDCGHPNACRKDGMTNYYNHRADGTIEAISPPHCTVCAELARYKAACEALAAEWEANEASSKREDAYECGRANRLVKCADELRSVLRAATEVQ